jgi:kynurenine formamidase
MRAHISWILLAAPLLVHAAEPLKLQRAPMPNPPWPQGDERGMANQIGSATWNRCAWHMTLPGAQSYELSQLRSNTMPLSPFAGPYAMKAKPTAGLPMTAHAFNLDSINEGADAAQQGTQFDALGHFAALRQPWDGKSPFPAEQAIYYGGFTQREVKPTVDSSLQRLGVDKVPPIVTSAVLLDAKSYVGHGQPMKPGQMVAVKDIEEMLKDQGLGFRGILPGDVVYIYTGWSDYWRDPDTEKFYYTKAPGLAYEAARYLADKRIVAIGLDAPFVDSIPEGMLEGKSGPADGTPPALPFAVHHHMLTQAGVHLVENVKLDDMARDRTWLACTMILPLREKGAAGSAIRPVAIGASTQSAKK